MSEITLKITSRSGEEQVIDVPTDMSLNLMEAIRAAEIEPEGTIGICGGMAMCGSCQCYVLSDHELPAQGDEEEAMLSEVFYVQENSRLGCQIEVTDALDGLEIEIAPES